MKINRFTCGNGEGMFENKKGYWVSYEDHLKALKELEENLTIPVVVSTCCDEAITWNMNIKTGYKNEHCHCGKKIL